METFIDQAPKLVKTAERLASLQNSEEEAKIFQSAKVRMIETGYDNWNGGVILHSLILEIPIELFSKIEKSREMLEKSIKEKMSLMTRANSADVISEVIISPVLTDESFKDEGRGKVEDEFIPSFWQQGYFRIFISHSVAIKESAHKLKVALAPFQITSFVAHDDIEPAHEWQTEIESALRTTDALIAIITPEFIASKWCDQEVGYALGRGKFVLPISKGATPYGFVGKIQGLKIGSLEVKEIAKKIVEILIQNESSSPRMTEVLVEKLVNSGSWDSSHSTIDLLEKTPRITSTQAGRLLKAIEDNIDVRQAFTVPERINELIKRSA